MDISMRKNYLESIKVPEKNFKKYLVAMSRYQDDWWLSKDDLVVAEKQIQEPQLLVPFVRLQDALETVLGAERMKCIRIDQISSKNKALKNEVLAAIAVKRASIT